MHVLSVNVGPEKINVFLDGVGYPLMRKIPNAQKILGLAREYDSSTDVARREAICEEVSALLQPGQRLVHETDSRLEWDQDDKLYLRGTKEPIPDQLAEEMLNWLDNGFPIDSLARFWCLLLLNPDKKVRTNAFDFVKHLEDRGIQITEHGFLIAYKSMRVKKKFDKTTGEEINWVIEFDEDTGKPVYGDLHDQLTFEPFHSGKYGMIVKMGQAVTQPRETCDSNPNQTCSSGLHVGAWGYVGGDAFSSDGFGSARPGEKAVLQVLVDPRNIVAVPYDYNGQKMRVCEYYPLALVNGKQTQVFLKETYYKESFEKIQNVIKEAKDAADKVAEDKAANVAEMASLTEHFPQMNEGESAE